MCQGDRGHPGIRRIIVVVVIKMQSNTAENVCNYSRVFFKKRHGQSAVRR